MDAQPGEVEEVEVFWMPGCSSCAKVKEFLAEKGIAYRSANIAEQPEKLDALVARGFKGVPVVRKGERYVHAVSLQPVSELVGVTFRANRLPGATLLDRWLDLLARTREIVATIPEARLNDLPVPNRPRTLRDLAGHIFQVPEAFLKTMVDGLADTRAIISRPCSDLKTGEELLRYVDGVLAALGTWRHDTRIEALPAIVPTYYGTQPLDEFVERSVWHSAQHARQLDFVVSGLNGSDKALPPEIYDGLPMPKGLWE